MERSASAQQEYASFLIRMWREADPAAPDAVTEWHGEVEHIQSGQTMAFASITELWECLRGQLSTSNSLPE
jgi:hypothetical protein